MNRLGLASLSIPDLEDRMHGCAYGLYVIKITSSHTEIPKKYNTQSLLGVEIAIDSATAEHGVVLNLK